MDKLQTIKSEAEELLNKMVDQSEVAVEEIDGVFHVTIKTEEAPTVIGRHGETIRAIQKILEVVLFRQLGEPTTILVNVNDYREKQKERLESIASETAARVQETKQSSYLRGFSSYERRIIHEYITQNYPDLTSYSVDEGKERRLMIDIKKEE